MQHREQEHGFLQSQREKTVNTFGLPLTQCMALASVSFSSLSLKDEDDDNCHETEIWCWR